MGTVYLARATGIGGFEREVALKLMHAHLKENLDFAGDLIEEAKLTVRIRHPNVVSVMDVGADPFGMFLVMEYIEGDTLAGLQRRATASAEKGLPLRYGMKLLMDALAGLHAAHELRNEQGEPANLVHRDFSPQNILVGTDGIGHLTDFGIAKAVTRIGETASGVIKGKIAYMAPEHARAERIDRRADVWSAGIVAWQLVAGRRLYPSQENEVGTLLKVVTQEPPKLREVKPDVPLALETAIAKALTMNVERRWSTAQAFRQALLTTCQTYGEMADTDEVAAFVRRITEPVLAERRTRAAEIVLLREQVGKLAEPTEMTPSAEILVPPPVDAAPTIVTSGTDATSVSDSLPRARRRPVRVILAAAGALAVVSVGAGVVASHKTTSHPEEPKSVEVHSAAPPTLPSTTTTIPAASSVPEAMPTLVIATAAPTTRAPPPAPKRASPAKPAATPTATGVLPTSPYHPL
jgi:serine/threonine-protein kinase